MRRQRHLSRASGPALEFGLSFSPAVFFFLVVMHGLSAVAILNLIGRGWGAALLLSLASASLLASLPLSGLAVSGRGLARVIWHADASWSLSDRRGRAWAAHLLSHFSFAEGLLLLSWERADGGRVSTVLVRTEENSEDFRRLRARLRNEPPA